MAAASRPVASTAGSSSMPSHPPIPSAETVYPVRPSRRRGSAGAASPAAAPSAAPSVMPAPRSSPSSSWGPSPARRPPGALLAPGDLGVQQQLGPAVGVGDAVLRRLLVLEGGEQLLADDVHHLLVVGHDGVGLAVRAAQLLHHRDPVRVGGEGRLAQV